MRKGKLSDFPVLRDWETKNLPVFALAHAQPTGLCVHDSSLRAKIELILINTHGAGLGGDWLFPPKNLSEANICGEAADK